MSKRRRITASINAERYAELERIAGARGVPVSVVVRDMVSRGLDKSRTDTGEQPSKEMTDE